jgi:hypothetical protein
MTTFCISFYESYLSTLLMDPEVNQGGLKRNILLFTKFPAAIFFSFDHHLDPLTLFFFELNCDYPLQFYNLYFTLG